MNLESPTTVELELKPQFSRGELVPDGWWELPPPERQSFFGRHWLFITTVVIPLLLSGVYLFVIAADQFTSETSFIVRASSGNDVGNLASLMSGQKLSRATDETYAVGEYMVSRDAMGTLVKENNLRDVFSRPQADFLSVFPNFFSRNNNEELFKHFKQFVFVENDPESGISRLTVKAFLPEDARSIAAALVHNGEMLVNRLNARAYQDAVRFSSQVVEEQKTKLVDVENQLTRLRNDQRFVDPNKELTAAFANLGVMTVELMQLQAEYTQKAAITAASPALASMRQRIAAYQGEIAKQREQLAGNGSSMATKLAAFEELVLSRELAAKGLEMALIHLANARQDAEQQRLYLETIVPPHVSDEALYPRRYLYMLAIAAFCLALFFVSRSFLRGVMEHSA